MTAMAAEAAVVVDNGRETSGETSLWHGAAAGAAARVDPLLRRISGVTRFDTLPSPSIPTLPLTAALPATPPSPPALAAPLSLPPYHRPERTDFFGTVCPLRLITASW